MKFEQRKSEAKEMVMSFLSTMSPPRGVDPQGLANQIDGIADAFARKMPTKGNFGEAVKEVFTRLRDTHLSNTWPPQAAFVLAMPKADTMGRAAAETFQVKDPVERYSRLMLEGDVVPEALLWGSISGQLPRRELERYRSVSVLNWVEFYRDSAATLMAAKYGPVVHGYFPRREAAE